MAVQRCVPKFGFKNFNRVEFAPINLDVISSLLAEQNATLVDLQFLQAHGLISKNDKVKILGRREINSAVEVHAHAFSKTASDSIEKAGGKIVLI